MSAWEASAQISRCLRGLQILIPAELFWRMYLSCFSWAELCGMLQCAWAERGWDDGLLVGLLLHGEGKLVRRLSSAWRTSLPSLVSEEGSLFLFAPALLACSALRFTHSGSGWSGLCPLSAHLQRRGCSLLSLLLRADSLPALVTHLKPSCFL